MTLIVIGIRISCILRPFSNLSGSLFFVMFLTYAFFLFLIRVLD